MRKPALVVFALVLCALAIKSADAARCRQWKSPSCLTRLSQASCETCCLDAQALCMDGAAGNDDESQQGLDPEIVPVSPEEMLICLNAYILCTQECNTCFNEQAPTDGQWTW